LFRLAAQLAKLRTLLRCENGLDLDVGRIDLTADLRPDICPRCIDPSVVAVDELGLMSRMSVMREAF